MKLRILILCGLATVTACHRDSGTTPAVKASAHVKAPAAPAPGPTAREQTATMVEAATVGKSQLPVSLKFEVLQRPVQGQPLQIAIALLPQITAHAATIEVTGSEAVPVAVGERQVEFAEVEPEQVYRHSINLTPTAEGVFLLKLDVSLKHDQMVDTRAFSVPIIVAPAVPGALSVGSAGSGGTAAARPPAPPIAAAQQRPQGGSPPVSNRQ